MTQANLSLPESGFDAIPPDPGSGNPLTMMVVDDEAGPRESLKLIFGNQFRVLVAVSGEQAVEIAKKEEIALAIVDIRMQGMNGIEVLRELKRIREQSEVIILTAYETLRTARDAVTHGASDYLSKPFDIPHIQEVVKRCEQRYRFLVQHRHQIQDDLNRAKNEFLSVLSHELNTPMNGIMGLQEIMTQTELSDEQRDLLRDMQGCSLELFEKINDILNYARLSTDAYAHSHELFNPASMVLKLSQRENLLRADEVKVEVSLQPNVPSLVQGPEYEIQIILQKLVDNAFKFTKEGTVDLSLESRYLDARHIELKYSVADTGVGIANEDLTHGDIFSPFSQGDASNTRNFGGMGMGLALCQRLCRELDSELKVESQEGKGSRFQFSIRVSKPNWEA